jgi:hypothetical protein
MHQQSTTTQRGNDDNQTVRSWWSEEDDAFLAEVEGAPGTLIHDSTEQEARDASLELVQVWREVQERMQHLTVDDFVSWMHLDPEEAKRIRSRSADGQKRRSLQQWNQLLTDLRRL